MLDSLTDDLTHLGFTVDASGWAWEHPSGLVVELGQGGWVRCYDAVPDSMLYAGDSRLALILAIEDDLRQEAAGRASAMGGRV